MITRITHKNVHVMFRTVTTVTVCFMIFLKETNPHIKKKISPCLDSKHSKLHIIVISHFFSWPWKHQVACNHKNTLLCTWHHHSLCWWTKSYRQLILMMADSSYGTQLSTAHSFHLESCSSSWNFHLFPISDCSVQCSSPTWREKSVSWSRCT